MKWGQRVHPRGVSNMRCGWPLPPLLDLYGHGHACYPSKGFISWFGLGWVLGIYRRLAAEIFPEYPLPTL